MNSLGELVCMHHWLKWLLSSRQSLTVAGIAAPLLPVDWTVWLHRHTATHIHLTESLLPSQQELDLDDTL